MENKKNNNEKVHIKQINPRHKLNKEEKRAITKYEMEHNDEILSKTMQFKALNSKKQFNTFDLPKTKKEIDAFSLPKQKNTIYETIKIKINDIQNELSKKKETLKTTTTSPNKNKKSLYDTVIIKLESLINSKNALKIYKSSKVTNIENLNKEKKWLPSNKNYKKLLKTNHKINIYSDELGIELYNLNKLALTQLSTNTPYKMRKHNCISRLNRIEKIHISKTNYLQYQKKLSKFAIRKLYYKLAPKETKKYKLYRTSVIISSIIFLITSIIITNWFIQGLSISKISNSLIQDTTINLIDEGTLYDPITDVTELKTEEEKNLYWKYLNTPLSSVDFTELLGQNKDTVGWLILNNTNINYPVVQTTNNEYYLKHAFDNSNNNAGWVFADFRDNFNDFNRNLVIYAHGRKDRVMFGSLTDTLEEKWYTNPENQIIQLSTIKYNTMWQIVSIYKVNAESYYITTDFSSDETFETFLSIIKSRSIYDFNINLTKNDKILTLSTCYNDNGIRLVVQAKLVKIHEK